MVFGFLLRFSGMHFHGGYVVLKAGFSKCYCKSII